MASEGASRGKFAQFVPHHLIADVDGDVLASVVYGDRVAYHLRHDCRGSRPSFNQLLFAFIVQGFYFAEQAVSNEGTFFKRTTHSSIFAFGFLILDAWISDFRLWIFSFSKSPQSKT